MGQESLLLAPLHQQESLSSKPQQSTKPSVSTQRNSRRYQPYSHRRHQLPLPPPLPPPEQQQEEPLLFGPVPSFDDSSYSSPLYSSSSVSSSSSFSSLSENPSSILEDSEIFDEFDDFVRSPAIHYMSSPPPSPLLTPLSSNEEREEQEIDFSDFPLFP